MFGKKLHPYCDLNIDDKTGVVEIYIKSVGSYLMGCSHYKKVLGATSEI